MIWECPVCGLEQEQAGDTCDRCSTFLPHFLTEEDRQEYLRRVAERKELERRSQAIKPPEESSTQSNPRVDVFFQVNLVPPLALVLPALEDSWERVYPLACALVRILEGRLAGLYFLGGERRLDCITAEHFKADAPGWFEKNRDRPLLLSGVYEALRRERFTGGILVVSPSPPHDLRDWEDTQDLKRTLFVTTAEAAIPGGRQVSANLGLSRILEVLEDPPVSAVVTGKGFLPLRYEVRAGGKASVSHRDGAFRLEVRLDGDHLEVHVKACCPISDGPFRATLAPRLEITRRSGCVEFVEAKTESPLFPKAEWRKIPEKFRPCVAAGIAREPYMCPHCDKHHGHDVLVCPQGRPILEGLPLNTAVVLTRDWYLSLSEFCAFEVPRGGKALTREGKLYTRNGETWRFVSVVSPYEEIDDGIWAILPRT